MADPIVTARVTGLGEWRNGVRKFAKLLNIGMAEALTTQGRIVIERCIRFTPPKTLAQGRKRVNKDIRKVIGGVSDDIMATAEHTANGNVRLFVKKSGEVWGVEHNLFNKSGNQGAIAAHHAKYRDGRGRVSMAGSFGNKTRGRWKFIDKLVVPLSAMKKYIRRKQKNIGIAKSGWLAALRAIGGKDPQNFVTRHGERFGGVRDLRSDPDHPRIIISNNARHILPLNRELNIVSSALKGREAAMLKDAELRIERAKKAANV